MFKEPKAIFLNNKIYGKY